MITLKKFVLEDVRCFEGVQKFNIRPLTFLVGENSTGKSTVLGCMQALRNFVGFDALTEPYFDFNVEPYQMGAFADIARKTGGRGGGRRKKFVLGFEMQIDTKETMHVLATLIERERGSEPALHELKIEIKTVQIVFRVEKLDDKTALFDEPGVISKTTTPDGKTMYVFAVSGEKSLFLTLRHFTFLSPNKKGNKQRKELIHLLHKIVPKANNDPFDTGVRAILPPYNKSYFESFAPIRSKPMRTYDPVREIDDPEGGGMPMTLMNMYRSDPKGWESMQGKLVDFGKASGLFTDIQIKRHGRAVNDPFQLQIKVIGPKTNIIDVGYGVSQILPILVRIFTARSKTTFLIQQPEVHLHPKAQAELCSSLIGFTTQRISKSFVIETHSDAMINRVRIEILNKKLKPEDVSLIYLEPSGNKVKVHNISFDDEANMIGVPDSYRSFFLREQDKLLGFGD